jgi:hypothetical protein
VVHGKPVLQIVHGDDIGHGAVLVQVKTLLTEVQRHGTVTNLSWTQKAVLSQEKGQPDVGYADTTTVGTQSPPCGVEVQTGVSVA